MPVLLLTFVLFFSLGLGVVYLADGSRYAVQLWLGVAFAGFAVLCLFGALRCLRIERTARVYSGGFAVSRSGRTDVFHFDEISDWTWSDKRPHRLFVRARDGRELNLFMHAPATGHAIATRLED